MGWDFNVVVSCIYANKKFKNFKKKFKYESNCQIVKRILQCIIRSCYKGFHC